MMTKSEAFSKSEGDYPASTAALAVFNTSGQEGDEIESGMVPPVKNLLLAPPSNMAQGVIPHRSRINLPVEIHADADAVAPEISVIDHIIGITTSPFTDDGDAKL